MLCQFVKQIISLFCILDFGQIENPICVKKTVYNKTFWIPAALLIFRRYGGHLWEVILGWAGPFLCVYVNYKFDSVWSNHLGTAQHTVAMKEQMNYCDFVSKDANVKILKKTIDNVVKSNQCNQCTMCQAIELRS